MLQHKHGVQTAKAKRDMHSHNSHQTTDPAAAAGSQNRFGSFAPAKHISHISHIGESEKQKLHLDQSGIGISSSRTTKRCDSKDGDGDGGGKLTYSTPAEARISMSKRRASNPRYPTFRQSHFTAGDPEQFFGAICERSGQLASIRYQPPFPKLNRTLSSIFRNGASYSSLVNSFYYHSEQCKKGLFVYIKDNRASMIPFSNAAYRNRWAGSFVQVPSKFSSAESLFRAASEAEAEAGGRRYPWRAGCISENMSTWFANGHLVRAEWPPHEMDSGVHNMRYLFDILCAERRVPDVAFFVNRRDFPLLTVDGTEPYEAIFGPRHKLADPRFVFDKQLPVLSGCTADGYADVPIPTWYMMAHVLYSSEGKYFPKSGGDYRDPFVPWEKKTQSKAVFRGSSTGQGVTPDVPRRAASDPSTTLPPETNVRMRAAKLSAGDPAFGDVLDAKITAWCTRPRSVPGHVELLYIDAPLVGITLGDQLSPTQQAAYKYVLHLPGHSAAMRLSTELAMGSVVLIPPSKYRLYFFEWLVPGVHFLPVAEDLSDLPRTVRWCRDNDDKCRVIATNARKFYERHLTRRGILDYMQNLLIQLRVHCGPLVFSNAGADAETFAVEHVPRKFLSPPESHFAALSTRPGESKIVALQAIVSSGSDGLQQGAASPFVRVRRAATAKDELLIRRACAVSLAATAHFPLRNAFECWYGEVAGKSQHHRASEGAGSGIYFREDMRSGPQNMERTLLDLITYPSSRRQAPEHPLNDVLAGVSVAIHTLTVLAHAQEVGMFCHNAFGPHAVVLLYGEQKRLRCNGPTAAAAACRFHAESDFPLPVICDLHHATIDSESSATLLRIGPDGKPRAPNFACDVAAFVLFFVHASTRRIIPVPPAVHGSNCSSTTSGGRRWRVKREQEQRAPVPGGGSFPAQTPPAPGPKNAAFAAKRNSAAGGGTYLRECDVRFIVEFASFFLRPIFPHERIATLSDVRRIIAHCCPFARTESEIVNFPATAAFPSAACPPALGPTDRCLVYDPYPPSTFCPAESFSLRECLEKLSESPLIAAFLPCTGFRPWQQKGDGGNTQIGRSNPEHSSRYRCSYFDPGGSFVRSPKPPPFPSLRDALAVRKFLRNNYPYRVNGMHQCHRHPAALGSLDRSQEQLGTLDCGGRTPSCHCDRHRTARLAKAFVELVGGPEAAMMLISSPQEQAAAAAAAVECEAFAATKETDESAQYDPSKPFMQ